MAPNEGNLIVNYFEDSPLSCQQLLEVLPDGIAFIDEHGVICHANERLEALTGYTRDELVGQTVEMLVPSRYRDGHVAHRDEFVRDPSARVMGSDLDLTLLRQDGSELAVDVALAPLTLDGKRWIVVAIRDNSAQRAAEHVRADAKLLAVAAELAAAEVLAKSEQRFRLAFENNMAGMIFVDFEDRILAVNDSFCQMIGRNRNEIIGKDSASFTHSEDRGITKEAHHRLTSGEADQVSYTKRYLHKDGRVIDVEVSKSPARDATGATSYFVVSVRDITQERALTVQLSHQALHDRLTGLANRVLFEDRLSQAYARAVRQGEWGAVLSLDLDDFQGVNDTFGHIVGDQLLFEFARRFEQVTRSSDTLSRLGGDQFLYLAEGLTSPTQAEEMAERLLGVLAEPFSLVGAHLEQHASIGVVVFDGTSKDCTELIQDADAALYEAKREGKGRYVLFTPEMHQQAVGRFALVQELGHSLQSGEISMHYQPIVDLTTSEVVGFEALMRWQHPERGQVPPDVFIPLAERSDLISELGSFALREAVGEAKSWKRTGARVGLPYVTVNLSARQFHDPDLMSMIEGALTASGLAPKRLLLEITESVALADVVGTASVIEHLDLLGVAIALDDFGTGYSSLSYLALLRPRIIKIDRSFVSPSKASMRNDTLLEAIVSLGHKLDMTVLAEGIETQGQLERLRHLGCELGQGYLFSPAIPAGEVAAMLAWEPGRWGQRLALSTPTPTRPKDQLIH
ncbi:MAG: EAL domain-containing protein [Acidimicrobiales bacterium]|jgi:diguanylate cyclase (GGDEF)-like protein/PAS domain S-box-containing protein